MSQSRILLVDDKNANIIALRAVLDSPKYELMEAQSGVEALRICIEHEFALIILDVHMPGLDGFETAKRIKATAKNKNAPIIFVTATFREDPSVRRGFEVGAIDYLGKPFDPEILKAKVGIYADLYLKTKRLALLETIPVGVIVADVDGQVYESNEETRKIWGGVPAVDMSSNKWAMARALSDGKSTKEERVNIEASDGTNKTILNSAYPIRGKDGTILGAVGILQDVTQFQTVEKLD